MTGDFSFAWICSAPDIANDENLTDNGDSEPRVAPTYASHHEALRTPEKLRRPPGPDGPCRSALDAPGVTASSTMIVDPAGFVDSMFATPQKGAAPWDLHLATHTPARLLPHLEHRGTRLEALRAPANTSPASQAGRPEAIAEDPAVAASQLTQGVHHTAPSMVALAHFSAVSSKSSKSSGGVTSSAGGTHTHGSTVGYAPRGMDVRGNGRPPAVPVPEAEPDMPHFLGFDEGSRMGCFGVEKAQFPSRPPVPGSMGGGPLVAESGDAPVGGGDLDIGLLRRRMLLFQHAAETQPIGATAEPLTMDRANRILQGVTREEPQGPVGLREGFLSYAHAQMESLGDSRGTEREGRLRPRARRGQRTPGAFEKAASRAKRGRGAWEGLMEELRGAGAAVATGSVEMDMARGPGPGSGSTDVGAAGVVRRLSDAGVVTTAGGGAYRVVVRRRSDSPALGRHAA